IDHRKKKHGKAERDQGVYELPPVHSAVHRLGRHKAAQSRQRRTYHQEDEQEQGGSQDEEEGNEAIANEAKNRASGLWRNLPDRIEGILKLHEQAAGTEQKDDKSGDGRPRTRAGLFGVS